VDRVALADHAGHGLTESRVRGALAALEAIGFLVREAVKGSTYRPTEAGLRRKPVFWRVAPEFYALFERANALAKRARGAGKIDRRPVPLVVAPQPSSPRVSHPAGHPRTNSPKETPRIGSVSLGEQPNPVRNAGLEAALSRLRSAVERGAA
jgi:hypothetical protein